MTSLEQQRPADPPALARSGPARAPTPWWFEWAVLRMVGSSLALLAPRVADDAHYYFGSLEQLGQVGWGAVLPEYPLPLAMLLWPLSVLTGLGLSPVWAVFVPLLAVDLAFARTLGSRAGRGAVRCWSWGVFLMGPLALLRLDIVAGVLLAASLLTTSPGRRGSLLALATAAKVFPVVALPIAAAGASRPSRILAPALAAGVALAAACVAIGGWARLVSPLTYQGDRGLQVESLAATPFVLGRLLRPDAWSPAYAPSKSWEITGPGVEPALAVSTAAQVAGLCLVAWLTWSLARSVRRAGPDLDPDRARSAMTLLVLGATCTFIATSKAFSPQYLLWILPVLAVACATPGAAPRRWVAAMMVTLGLSQVVYPWTYADLIQPESVGWAGTAALVLRNLLFLALTVAVLRRAAGAVALVRDVQPDRASGQADSTS